MDQTTAAVPIKQNVWDSGYPPGQMLNTVWRYWAKETFGTGLKYVAARLW